MTQAKTWKLGFTAILLASLAGACTSNGTTNIPTSSGSSGSGSTAVTDPSLGPECVGCVNGIDNAGNVCPSFCG